LKRHWLKTALLLGVLARAGVAFAQDAMPPAGWDPMPVSPSYAPFQPGAPAPMGVPGPSMPASSGLDKLLTGPNAFHDGDHDAAAAQPQCPVLWITPEGLLAWTKRGPLNAPLTTNSIDTTTSVGAIDQAGTFVTFGGNGIPTNVLRGGRLSGGLNLSEACCWLLPLEFSIFYVGEQRIDYTAHSDDAGFPPLFRPIFATQNNVQSSYVSSLPGIAAGGITVSSATQVWGFDVNAVAMTGPIVADGVCNQIRLAASVGGRYLDLSEGLEIFSTTTSINPSFSIPFEGATFGQGNMTQVMDIFRTHNRFSGAQAGARLDWSSGPFFINMAVKAAIGAMDQDVNIYGITTLVETTGTRVTLPGGILAVPSSGGNHHRTEFGFVPEGSINVGIDITQNIRVQAGYNILWINTVVRPGAHVNANVDTRQVLTDLSFDPTVKVTDPRFQWHDTDFWLQALNIGLTFRY
jgi:hypothetical protein